MKKVFITYCDDNYFQWYEPWLKSVKTFEPESLVSLHMINSKKRPRYSIRQTVSYKNGTSPADCIICHKIQFMLDTMEKIEGDVYILTDIDMILNRPLEGLDGEWDIAGFLVKQDKVAGGFLAAKKNERAMKFLEEYNKFLITPPHFFNKDQPSLAKFYNRYSDNLITWKQMSRDYLDHTCNPNSFIWSAHKLEFGSKFKRLLKFKERFGI